MGVTAREHPKGSGRWLVFVSKGKFRFNQIIKEGQERSQDVAAKAKIILDTMGVRAALNYIRGNDPEQLTTPTLKEYAKKWAEGLDKGDLKLSTRTMYRSMLTNHIVPSLGKHLICDVDHQVLKGFFESKVSSSYSSGRFRRQANAKAYREKPPEIRQYSRDTVRIMAMTLRALLGEAVRDGYLSGNPVQGMTRYYRRRKKDKSVKRSQVYTLDELYAVEDTLRSRRQIFGEDYEFSLLMSRTGMRIGEAMGLQAVDLDMREKTIQIERNIPAGTGTLEESTKTHSGERTVDMGEDLWRALTDMLARRRQEALAGKRGRSEWLFSSPQGGPYDYNRFYERWNRAQALAKVRQRSPHSLRHTYASQQLEAGVSIADVARQLGHANPGITLGIYVHFIPKKSGQIRNALDRTRAAQKTETASS